MTRICASPRALPFVLAVLLALAAILAVPRPAAATGGACGNWFDNPGTVYSNGDYRAAAGGNFWDSYAGRYTHLNIDIQSWRYTGTGSDGFISGHCYRQSRASVWVDDGDYGTLYMHHRTWANLGTCAQLVSDYWTGGTWGGAQEHYSGWWDYSGCGGPNTDVWGFGKNPDWTPYYPDSVPSPYTNL